VLIAIVEPSLENDYVVAIHQVYEAVLVIDTAGPTSLKDVAQLLWLADARGRIPDDVLE
jgi:hypothetical protein